MFIGKQFDMIIGVDIHIVQPPGPVPPVPIPHPFIGIVFDPMEFVPFIGASILVNGIPRAQAGTAVKSVPPHIPIGGMFIKPPMSEGEIFMGSMTVNAEGEPLAYMGAPTLTCQDVGMISIPRPKRKSKTKAKSMMLPTSSLICIPKGGMSMALGALMISMVAIGMKVGLAAFKKFRKIKKAKEIPSNIHMGQQGKHIPGHNNHIAGRSELTSNPQDLLNRVKQGDVGSINSLGSNKHRVNFGQNIGNYVDPVSGVSSPTTNAIIHSGKNGAHIVPARP